MGLMRLVPFAVACLTILAPLSGADAQISAERPWDVPGAVILLDPFEGNAMDWDKVAADKHHVLAVIHRSSIGLRRDTKFVDRAKEARAKGILYAAFHLATSADPIQQADLALDQMHKAGATLLALDIEDERATDISLPDAVRFLDYVHAKTGRWPMVYVNKKMLEKISAAYDASSSFAKAPLWVARFQPTVGALSKNVWPTYTIWQFKSEINCTEAGPCPITIDGTAYDMDVDIFNGDRRAFRRLFGAG